MRDRNNQQQVWCDKEFAMELKKIMAKKLLNGTSVKNVGQLTKEILNTPSWKKILKELVESKQQFQIKMDSKRLFP